MEEFGREGEPEFMPFAVVLHLLPERRLYHPGRRIRERTGSGSLSG